MSKDKLKIIKQLQEIPGVGVAIAEDLYDIGIRAVSDLKTKNPQRLYEKSCKKAGVKIDRCLLYVYRCAVYYASTKKHNSKKLLWWNWMDKTNSK